MCGDWDGVHRREIRFKYLSSPAAPWVTTVLKMVQLAGISMMASGTGVHNRLLFSTEPTNAEREPSDVHGGTRARSKAFENHNCDANASKVTNSNVRFQQVRDPWSKSTRSCRKFSPLTLAPLLAVRYLCYAWVTLRETSTQPNTGTVGKVRTFWSSAELSESFDTYHQTKTAQLRKPRYVPPDKQGPIKKTTTCTTRQTWFY